MFKKLTVPVLIITSLMSTHALAQSSQTPQINHAYIKGSTYDLVVRYNPNSKLSINLDGHRKASTKFNKQGWGTYNKIAFQSQGNVYFSKFTWRGYKKVGDTYYYAKRGNDVSFYNPKYSYDDFAKWTTTNVAVQHYWKWNGIGDRDLDTYAAINSQCHTTGDWSNPEWKTCMQTAYGRYLKPETFATDQNITDFLTMIGTIENGLGGYADQSDVKSARAIYYRLAVTK